MIGSIICGGLIFALSEVSGEVYHQYNKNSNNNVAIKTGKKIADCTEVLYIELAAARKKAEAKREFKKASNPKTIAKKNESVDDIMEALDKQIENINREKTEDIIKAESLVVNSICQVCDLLVKQNNLSESENAELVNLANNGRELSEKILNNKKPNHGNIKKSIQAFANKVQPYVEKNAALEESKKTEPIKEEKKETSTFTKTKDEKKFIPNFTKTTTIKDIKAAAKKGNK